ncbi:MAG: rpiA [Ferruginibacter sp.]|uniref:ribose-5-phosphate isomerase RpiA n=1 Tax=Ferruginibacter sp. TaxID=1940288 RepID=UPI002659E547|nr:ribose-5-phosphate isomerase RpiA [Ferruginibacter sp.]MDB5279160.1 rpiA [Ferruginibacter sp.]
MDFKKAAAVKAAGLIQSGQIIGLGAGSTIAYMVTWLAEQVQNGLQIQLLTSSFTTRQLLLQNGFTVLPAADVEKIDLYFDGCDQVDHNLQALKSGGGIHTREKLLAAMATRFIIAGDDSKYVDRFTTQCPLVIELLPEALRYVTARIQQLFPGTKTDLRMGNKKDGATITDNGNYLMDVWFDKWPDLESLNLTMKNITGVVETSLFYNLVTKVIIAGNEGIQIIEK